MSDPGPVFHALADPTRRHVVERLVDRGSVTATEVAGDLPISRQAVAKHLSALAEAGLVESRREGREIRYRLEAEPLAGAMSWMAAVGGRWDERLAALRGRLGGG